jgi:hypothetical protein
MNFYKSNPHEESTRDKNVIQINMQVVECICNFVSFFMGAYLLAMLYDRWKNAHSNTEKRKITMYTISIRYIVLFMMMILCLVLVPFYPEGHSAFDGILQVLLLLTTGIFIRHWNESLRVHIKSKYTAMLTLNHAPEVAESGHLSS